MPLLQLVAIFLLEEVAFLLYTLLILRSSQFCFEFKKKMQPSPKVGPAMPGQPARFRRAWYHNPRQIYPVRSTEYNSLQHEISPV